MRRNRRERQSEKTNTTERASTRVITGKARSSFMKVLRLEEDDSGHKKCGTAILIPKKDKKTVQSIKAAIREAAKEKFGRETEIFETKRIQSPLNDGDEAADDPENNSYGEEARGHYIINAKGYKLPQVVDKHNERIEDIDELEEICVSGNHFRFSITFRGYTYESSTGGTKKGVRVLLNNLMFVAEGERLDGGRSAEEDFEDYADESTDDEDNWD